MSEGREYLIHHWLGVCVCVCVCVCVRVCPLFSLSLTLTLSLSLSARHKNLPVCSGSLQFVVAAIGQNIRHKLHLQHLLHLGAHPRRNLLIVSSFALLHECVRACVYVLLFLWVCVYVCVGVCVYAWGVRARRVGERVSAYECRYENEIVPGR